MPIKSLDDLSEDPLPSVKVPTPAARAFLLTANNLLDNPRYEFAYDTITRMRDWVKANGVVTTKMEDALTNIRVSVPDGEDDVPQGRGRRYEGWNGRNR